MPALAEDIRPKTLRSGITLQPKYAVQHRSDMLISEQIETVTEKQSSLMEVLEKLEDAKTEEEVDSLRAEAQGLKEKADAGLVILNILYKINHELKYARQDLDEALDHQHGDILAARKRVMWLEDRMGLLCGKVRLRGQPSNRPSQRTRGSTERGGMTITFRSNVSDSDVSEDEEPQFGRGKALPPIRQINSDAEDYGDDRGARGGMGRMIETPSLSGSEDFRDVQAQMRRPGMMDTPSSATSSSVSPAKMGLLQQKGIGQDSESEESDEDNTSPVPPTPKPAGKPQHSPLDSSGSKEGSEANDQIAELPSMFQREKCEYSGLASRSPDSLPPTSVVSMTSELSAPPSAPPMEAPSAPPESPDSDRQGPISVEQQPDVEEEEEAEGKKEDEEQKEEVQRREEGAFEPEKPAEESQEKSEETEETPEKVGPTTEGEVAKGKEEKTFITEVSVQTNKSRVTIVSPKREDTRQAFLREISEEERDVIMEYWQSEHHRFEYGDYADVLTQLDPLSYHQMGLAVPGSFLRRVDKEFEDLPWNIKPNEKKSSDITDIHKRALDKLALKVHNMYDKVFRATMLSVRPTKKTSDGQREVSFFKSIDSKEGTMSSSVVGSKAPVSTAQAEGTRPETIQSLASVELSKAEKRSLGVATSGRLVYYPKPIPPPEVLPLTRTTVGKEYPKLADSFEESNSKPRKPAIRIADQRNLAQETKLSLYKERSRGRAKGPSTTEQKFRMMLQEQRSAGSSRKADSATKPSLFKAMTNASVDGGEDETEEIITNLDDGVDSEGSVWSKMKPKSRNREYSGLKWERVKTIVHNNLVSKRVQERIDAAKHLGLLRVGDAMVFFALKERMRNDEDQRVRYEAAKSLMLVGCWDEDVQQVALKYLVIGNTEIRLDLIRTMQEGKNVQYVDKTLSTFPELVKVLSHFSKNPDPEDSTSLEAAVLLGKLCVNDDNGETRLKQSLRSRADTHQKAKSLEILVKQLNCKDKDIVKSTLEMIKKSYVWKYRVMAAELLITLGKKYVCKDPDVTDEVFEVLEKRLWDEPTKEVRTAAAKALTALGMFGKACDRVEKRLEDSDEDARAEAVISVGTLGMKNEKITRLLLEMLELDASDYVRLMVVRTFVTLNSTDKRIIRALKERERAEGALGREAKKAVQSLEALTQLPPTTSPRRSVTPSKKIANSAMSFVRPFTQSV